MSVISDIVEKTGVSQSDAMEIYNSMVLDFSECTQKEYDTEIIVAHGAWVEMNKSSAPYIFSVTLKNNGKLHTVDEIFLDSNDSRRAINEAINVMRESHTLTGKILYVSHEVKLPCTH